MWFWAWFEVQISKFTYETSLSTWDSIKLRQTLCCAYNMFDNILCLLEEVSVTFSNSIVIFWVSFTVIVSECYSCVSIIFSECWSASWHLSRYARTYIHVHVRQGVACHREPRASIGASAHAVHGVYLFPIRVHIACWFLLVRVPAFTCTQVASVRLDLTMKKNHTC